jgi:filamentous hemagglutinin family protein
MTNVNNSVRDASILTLSFLAWQLGGLSVEANPTGGTVAQGSATINSSGSQLTINQTSSGALINWSSFNIGVGETTTFVQPSSSSVAWNQINGGNPSQILGNLNANGYVVLQNQSGFVVGGQAAINTHGLVMTTSPTPAPNLSSGGAWAFDAPPPAAQIINYGQITTAGGPVFLIANNIENNGTISAPGGKIGLYAGEQVLVSASPNGRGLSAKVTLPQGSVDNQGNLIADAGSIVAQAQTVNNNGLVQANSVQNNNGVIELVASDNVNLGASSDISAQGGSTGISSGGSVTVKSDNTFSDQTGSTINVAGGAQGGNGGQVEISAPQMSSIQSVVHGQAAAGFEGGVLTIDPANIWLASATTDPTALAGYTVIDVNSYSGLSAINVQADDNIILDTLWTLASVSTPATLNLTAASGNITFNTGSGIIAPNTGNGQNYWNINLAAGNDITLNAATIIQANAGRIDLNAVNVDVSGKLQADSIGQANGVIDVNASGNLTLEAGAVIEAQGDTTSVGASPGGFVTLQAGNSPGNIYSDTSSSKINVSGQNGGRDGIVEIFGYNLGTDGDASLVQSLIDNVSAVQFAAQTGDVLLVNPYDITLSQNPTGTSTDGNGNSDANFYANNNTSDLAAYSQIDLHALDNIELSSSWTPPDATVASSLSLTAGNSIIFDQGTSLAAGMNWNVNLTAGTGFVPTTGQPQPASGSDGVYLNGGSYLQTQNGDINVWAANEVILDSGAIRTFGGGSINVTAEYGDVNAGDSEKGYLFGNNYASYPYYYSVDPNLGGISTGAGGNVTITAGGNVNSYLPNQNDYNNNNYGTVAGFDFGGSGAFGPEPGNVTITAGGSVLGNYVVANGAGIINAGQNAGVPVSYGNEDADFALSLVKGSWSVNAQNIYLDDVLNPNGVFNDSSTIAGGLSPGAHVFNYDPQSSLSLDAANAVEITGAEVPLVPASDYNNFKIPVLLPPTLQIITGVGGLTLDADVILFPSAYGNVNITTLDGGNFISRQNPTDPYDVNTYSLQMSDTGVNSPLSLENGLATYQWSSQVGNGTELSEIFGISDHAPTPPELNNPNPVEITVNGNMENVNIYTTKATDLTVNSVTVGGQTMGGNMFNTSLIGENLHASDSTSIHVAGSISYSPIYTFTSLTQPIVGPDSSDPSWDAIFSLLVDDNPNDFNSAANPIPLSDVGNNKLLSSLASSDLIFGSNPGFIYSPATKQLGYTYQMSSAVESALTGTMTVIVKDSFGNPEVRLNPTDNQYYFVTTTVNFVPPTVITALYNLSHGLNADGSYNPNGLIAVKNSTSLSGGFQLGGPGEFTISAGSMDLGSSGGIISWGVGDAANQPGGVDYSSLAASLGKAAGLGASITVDVAGNLGMFTSAIASLAGGDVTVNSSGGEIDLGLPSIPLSPFASQNISYGIYTSEGGSVNVTANGNINIDTARIATFNGGDVTVESYNGDVNAGNGINEELVIPVIYVDPKGQIGNNTIQNPRPYGSGIMALSPSKFYQVAGGTGLPGDITVTTPNGNIVSTLGGISQFALGGTVAGGPKITLTAGTVGIAATKAEGNIDLGQGGVIGGTVDLSAQGSISGLIVSRQNSTVNAVHNVDVTVLSGGSANVSAGGTLSGTLIGVSGVSASGGEGISATMLSANVSANGGAAQNTLGAATASSASQSAANQSSNDAKQQLASDNTGTEDDNNNNKKKNQLRQKVKRVTVILPAKT